MSRKYALVIGIENYPKESGQKNVPYALNDARAIAGYLEKDVGFVSLDLLTDKDASYQKIMRAIRRLFYHVTQKDFVAIFYAGHGYYTEEGGYLIPASFKEFDDIDESTCVSFDSINKRLRSKKPTQFLFLLDTCHSGSVLSQVGLRKGETDSARTISMLAPKIEKQFERMVRETEGTGSVARVIFASCSPSEQSQSDDSLGHGVFTHFFLEALSGKYLNSMQDSIRVEDIISYTKEKVMAFTREKSRKTGQNIFQTPNCKTQINSDFRLPIRRHGWQSTHRPFAFTIEEAPLMGTLFFTFNVDDAQVDILGNRFSSKSGVRLRIRNIPVGRHLVQAVKEGYHDWGQEVEVLPDGKTEVSVNLEPLVVRPKSGKIWTDPLLGMPFVFVEGGSFEMGDLFGDGYKREKPVHSVTLSDYWIGQYPVTFDEYDRYCGQTGAAKPNDAGWGRGIRPVINVSWEDAVAFAQWLSQKTGRTFRLPTEGEWEYAARSRGRKEKWPGIRDGILFAFIRKWSGTKDGILFGEIKMWFRTRELSRLSDYAWYDDNSSGKNPPVGEKRPNAIGLYDMSGNVWEWCSDWFSQWYYEKSPVKDPTGPDKCTNRVVRGGSRLWNDWHCRVSFRYGYHPARQQSDLGFRLVLASGH